MNKIRILPDNLANQIAAGEVVERPASVVKELVENAIDAGASRISVEIELGGRRLMRVSDDGEGMSRDDAVLAFERHATSKITSVEDLGRIITLGFRGEALASIASVAEVELITNTADDLPATCVVVEGGRLKDVRDAARDRGTTISVRNLFFNTPARRKFMRSEATENYHLTGIVQHYALAHPEIAFKLSNNGREVLRTAPAKDLKERAFQLFGSGLLESLVPVSGGREFVAKISGYVSAPRERRTTRDSQYFFVNSRFVRDKVLSAGLQEGYRSVLPHGVYPVAFLFLDIPFEEIDVNVHPAKTEVRFRRTEAVKEAIADAVRNALASSGVALPAREHEAEQPVAMAAAAPSSDLRESEPFELRAVEPQPRPVRFDFEPTPAESIQEFIFSEPEVFSEPEARQEEPVRDDPQPKASAIGREPELPPVNTASHLAKPVDVGSVSSAKIRPLGQLHESFIIAVDDEGLLLIDQHVAHERILFDKFRKAEADRPIGSQALLLPETVDLTPAQTAAFEAVESELEMLGFETMRLSGRTVAIKTVPSGVQPADARNLFAEILDVVDDEKRGGARATLRDEVAASLACKAAIKINMKLTPEKMQWLIDGLLRTTSPTTCPHGRPVILRLSMKDIERGFHRT
ncbi:MAG: DNA mismatch repair endonuclease MutL [Acidobacteriota bacterium]|nr:MAG: DNA mismatch repair endonuclease MutL [Acidobacteriota bacterium]